MSHDRPPTSLVQIGAVKPGQTVWTDRPLLVLDVLWRLHSTTDVPVVTIRTDPPSAALLSLPAATSLWVVIDEQSA